MTANTRGKNPPAKSAPPAPPAAPAAPDSPAAGHAAAALAALTAFRAGNAAAALVRCDTPGCGACDDGSRYDAVLRGWRHDTSGLLRCPRCHAAGWPPPATAPPAVPDGLYEAWWAGDETRLGSWLDQAYPLPEMISASFDDSPPA